jgi:hypothetical protein
MPNLPGESSWEDVDDGDEASAERFFAYSVGEDEDGDEDEPRIARLWKRLRDPDWEE